MMQKNIKTKKEQFFTKASPFVNRVEEKRYLHQYLASNPERMLWLYGPKSTGKTRLISTVLNELDDSYYISSINFRGLLIVNYETFIFRMFQAMDDLKSDAISSAEKNLQLFAEEYDHYERKSDIFLGFARVSTKIRKAMESKEIDPFNYAIKVFKEINNKGYKPVLVFDEIQELRDLYMNGDAKLRSVLKETFAFFIRLTKELQLCHVISSTSESTFIEEIYNTTKLKNTSNFYKINHLPEKDVINWMLDEDLTQQEAGLMWEKLGGSPHEIWNILVDFKNGNGSLDVLLDKKIEEEYWHVKFNERFLSDEERKEFFHVVVALSQNNIYCEKKQMQLSWALIEKMVEKDIWFYDSANGQITANSESIRQAFKKMATDLESE